MSKDIEHKSQCALMKWAGMQSHRYAGLNLLFAIPNGGNRNVVTGAKLKREGVKKGVLDLFLPVSRGGFHGLWIEMKAPKGKLSVDQKRWIEDLEHEGYETAVCYSSIEAINAIKKYYEGRPDTL